MSEAGDFRRALKGQAALRTSLGNKAERAALHFARWQGLTDDATDDIATEKASLDAILDDMEPEEWSGIEKAAAQLGDATFKGLLTYAVGRVRDQNAESIRSLQGRHTHPIQKPDRDRS